MCVGFWYKAISSVLFSRQKSLREQLAPGRQQSFHKAHERRSFRFRHQVAKTSQVLFAVTYIWRIFVKFSENDRVTSMNIKVYSYRTRLQIGYAKKSTSSALT